VVEKIRLNNRTQMFDFDTYSIWTVFTHEVAGRKTMFNGIMAVTQTAKKGHNTCA